MAALVGASRLSSAAAASPPAAPLSHHLALPAVSADGLGTEAPNPAPVIENLYQRWDDGLLVSGEVRNPGQWPVTNIVVRVAAVRGDESAVREVSLAVAVTAPSGISPFTVWLPGFTDTGATLSATVVAHEVTPSTVPSVVATIGGISPLQTGPYNPKTGIVPYSTTLDALNGVVSNSTELPVTNVSVLVAAYDDTGHVVWTGLSGRLHLLFAEGDAEPVLAPGTSGSFIVGIPKDLAASVVGELRFRAFVNAQSLPAYLR